MPNRPTQLQGDTTPVTGGVSLPSCLVAKLPDDDVATNAAYSRSMSRESTPEAVRLHGL